VKNEDEKKKTEEKKPEFRHLLLSLPFLPLLLSSSSL
jgi:hypothetical protein